MANGVQPVGIKSSVTTPWATAGLPDVFAAIAHVSIGAFRSAWRQKWSVHMRLRPEELAARVDLAFRRPELLEHVPGLASLKEHIGASPALLELVRAQNANKSGLGGEGSLLLSLLYMEGSPTHPSLPAGHAAVAGACATVLKAMLQTFEEGGGGGPPQPRNWTADGRAALEAAEEGARPYVGADAGEMTINGEVNKLASNIAFGRDWAGVHYRADGEGGMRLGEQYAISYLRAKLAEYKEDGYGLFGGWLLEKFDGTVVRISSGGVEPA